MLYILSLIMFLTGFGGGYFYMVNNYHNMVKKYNSVVNDYTELENSFKSLRTEYNLLDALWTDRTKND